MQRVTTEQAKNMLWDWLSEHNGHETDVNPGSVRVSV
jgi:hypothetical protein